MSVYDDVVQKITCSSTLSAEVKEILNLMVSVVSSSNRDRDLKVAKLEQQAEEFRIETQRNFESLQASLEEKRQAALQTLSSDIKIGLSDRDELLTAANSDIKHLKDDVRTLKNALDEQDAYIRRESLLFSGSALPEYNDAENCADIAREIIRTNLKLPIEPIISTAHRMGPPPAPGSNKPDKRDIVVRFSQRDTKYQVLKATRQKKIPGLYASESLTKTRKTILLTLRRMAKDDETPVNGTMTHNGRVFAFTKPAANSPSSARNLRTEINTLDRLESFCVNFVKQPLSNFLKPFN